MEKSSLKLRNNLFQSKNEWFSLVALFLIFILPFTIVVYQLISEIHLRIELTQRELHGTEYLRPLEQLLHDLPESQLFAHRYLSYGEPIDPLQQQQAQIEDDFLNLAIANQTYGDLLETSDPFQSAQQTWQTLQQQIEAIAEPSDNLVARSVTNAEIEKTHHRLIQQIRALIAQTGDLSNLILDPDLDSYYLMDTSLLKLPEGQDLLTQLRYLGEDIVRRKALPPEERGAFITRAGLVQANLAAIQQGLAIAFRHHPSPHLASVLESPLQVAVGQIESFLELLQDKMIASEAIALSQAEYDAAASTALQASFALWQSTIDELDELLHVRLQGFVSKIYLIEGFGLLVLVAVIYVFVVFFRNLIDRRRSTWRLSTQHAITKILAESDTLEAAAAQILQAIGEGLSWDLGGIWQIEPKASALKLVALWHQSPDLGDGGNSAKWTRSLVSEAGLPGHIWQTAEPVWISDLARDRQFLHREMAEQLGMQAVCGFPILGGNEVLGVLTFFSRSTQDGDRDLRQMMTAISSQIGQFIKTKQAEAALRHSEELQRVALSAASMGVWEWNIVTNEETWSSEVERVYGLEPGTSSYCYEDFLGFVHPDDRQKVQQDQEQTLRDGAEYKPEFRIYWPDGTLRWVTSRGNVLRDENGKPLRLTGISMDITERKQAEIALAASEHRLRQAEEKYRSIFENAVTGIFQTTPDGRYISANPALARIYGYASVSEMLSSVTDITHQIYVKPGRRQAFVQQMAEHGCVAEFESEVHRKDGRMIWVSENAIAVKDETGSLLYFEGTVEDITDRKQTQAALTASEERFRTLLTNIPGAFYRCAYDTEWTMEFLSDAIADICGYPASDFINSQKRSFGDIIPPEDSDAIAQHIDAAVAKRQPYMLEYRMIHANGSVRWVYEKGQAIFMPDGEIQCLDGVIFDITERKQAEQFQNSQKQVLEAIASGLELNETLTTLVQAIEAQDTDGLAAILLLDTDGIHLRNAVAPSLPSDYKRIFNNLKIGPAVGCCGTAVYRQRPVVVSDVATSPLWTNYREVALRNGLRSCWSMPIFSSQGAVLGTFGIYHRYPYTPDSKDWELIETAAHLAGIAIERKRTEDELHRAKDSAEESSRAKSQFLANMSHELRTPLNAIIGYSEMLQEDAEDFGYGDIVPDLENIRNAGKHLLALINDILDISKIEAGRMELYLETFPISLLIQEVETTILPMIEKNGNVFQVNCAPDLSTMHADLTKLRQILFNLLSNAAKFTKHGTIALTVSRQEVNPDGLEPAQQGVLQGSYIAFTVTDTGIGMTPEQLEKVFQAFTQADASTTRKYGGTGLGLAISRHFCQMMDGDIAVTSRLGQGSSFTVQIPIEVGKPQSLTLNEMTTDRSRFMLEQSVLNAIEPGMKNAIVLVIDDDSTAHTLIAYHLGKKGFRVEGAKTGEAGLLKAKAIQPHVIILDVMLPNMSGWEVLTTLKTDPTLARIPVIMMTILDDKGQGFALGAADYLTKPIDHKQLSHLLERYRSNNPTAFSHSHVLIVEDDPATRDVLRRMMTKEGWTVSEAANGQQGLEKFGLDVPDLVLLDLMMPEMDGFQFIESIRQQPAWRSVPVIVVTAMELTSADRKRLNGYVQRVLQKGKYSRDQLLHEVQELVMNCLPYSQMEELAGEAP